MLLLLLSYSIRRIPQRLNLMRYELKTKNLVQAFLYTTNKKLIIYVHGPRDLISNHILTQGKWERDWIVQMTDFIKANDKPQLLDLGCNIGVYTLTAAALGCHVIAIDAYKPNLDLLLQSVMINGFQDRVHILWNAVSNKREGYKVFGIKENIGGQFLIKANSSESTVSGIYLDDVLDYVTPNKKIIIKIDIQGFEVKAFEKSEKLFETGNVIAVLVEWILIKDQPEVFLLIAFFMSRSYKPYSDFHSRKSLKVSKYRKWPGEVVWRKSTT